MPFVQRTVEPRRIARVRLHDDDGLAKVRDGELEAVANGTLCNALRQLASLVAAADGVFADLGAELAGIRARGRALSGRIQRVGERVGRGDPKKVPVPEGDLSAFATLTTHYQRCRTFETGLFSVATRPNAVKALYEAAARTPVPTMRQLDRWRRDGCRSSKFFVCTPVLGERRRKLRGRVDIDIETSMPAAVEELRRWTSEEALGDVTVTPDCASRIAPVTLTDGDATDGTLCSDDEGVDHKLPSPEEQLQVVALKFPAEVVRIDVSGRSFDRMSARRRSAAHAPEPEAEARRRGTRPRRPRSRRRNTLAGTDQKEIRDALTAGEETPSPSSSHVDRKNSAAVSRSKSSDILRSSTKKESPETKKSHFNTLKQWGRSRYDKLMNKTDQKNISDIDDFNVYETVTVKRKRDLEKERRTHERNSSISSSEKSGVNMPAAGGALSSVMSIAVKLRESSAQRRQRRNRDEPHSSSGNWSASSESGRASIGSEITSTTHPKSTTTTSTNSLNAPAAAAPNSVNSRRRFNVNTSTSSSVTSEGTLTPDIIHDLHEDGETSSVYSCDTEGYYTSFHMDSGLKTLKEEDSPPTPLHSTSAFSNSGSNNTVLSAENEYELFGKGSTSTTTSSAGTVCTTLRAAESSRSLVIGPAVPERKSSLSKLSKSPESSLERDEKTGTVKRSPGGGHKPTVVGVLRKKTESTGDVSPDSGHNTSSSPIESINSPNGARSGSDFEFSESSDMEGPERIERIRVKTTINSSRIPSMCVITPPHSDDESIKSATMSLKKKNLELELKQVEANQEELKSTDSDKENCNINSRIINTGSKMALINVNPQSGYATVESIEQNKLLRAPSPSGGTVTVKEETPSKSPAQPLIKASLMPLNNMLGKLRTNIVNFANKRDRSKSPSKIEDQPETVVDSGEYVTIADVRNNNEVKSQEVCYVNDVVNKNLTTVLTGKIRDAEYVSLNELPLDPSSNSLERKRQGARVTLDAEGKVVYSSDSLKRKKSHSTFEPGPFIKPSNSPLPQRRIVKKPIRPVLQDSKVVIRASTGVAEVVRKPPTAVVCAPRGVGPAVPPSNEEKDRVASPGNTQGAPSPQSSTPGHRAREMCSYEDRMYFDDPRLRFPQKYSTLPSKKTQFFTQEVQERSVTPDITRGLERICRFEENRPKFYNDTNLVNQRLGIPVRMPQVVSTTPVKSFSTQDLKLSEGKSEESFRISPIDPVRTSGGFKASTPSSKDLKAASNLESKLLSPKKSTMSNEELYAVIHKSKKKMNICDEVPNNRASPVEVASPTMKNKQPESGYLDKSRSRLSWSPSKGEYVDFNSEISPPHNDSRTRQSWACSDRKGPQKTSTLDFKRLLLQKSSLPNTGKKLSAVEQLKLSKQQIQTGKKQNDNSMTILDLSASPRSFNRRLGNPPGSPIRTTPEKQKAAPKILSPRSQWKFNSPRSDVLSSPILEDCREDDSNSSGSIERRASPRMSDSNKVREERRYQSVSERLQAQRAQFFGQKADSKPTLETAF